MSVDDPNAEVPIAVSASEVLPGGVEVPIGEPRETTISRGALDLLHGNVSPLADRRQRAREAYWDTREGAEVPAVEAAIETATRVRIAPEIVLAAVHESPIVLTKDAIAAAFRAAGFEVEE